MENIQIIPKLFIVDDDVATRLLIAEIVDVLSVDIVEAESGAAAVDLFKIYTNEIVLVLLDIRLPDCTGWELVKQLRVINPSVSIVALSALGEMELVRKIKGSGFTSYKCKPFDIREMERLIKFHATYKAEFA